MECLKCGQFAPVHGDGQCADCHDELDGLDELTALRAENATLRRDLDDTTAQHILDNDELQQRRDRIAELEGALRGLGIEDESFGLTSYGRCEYCTSYFKDIRGEHGDDCDLEIARAALKPGEGGE